MPEVRNRYVTQRPECRSRGQINKAVSGFLQRRTVVLVVLILAVHGGLLGFGAWQHTPSVDETGHLAAGLSHWEFGVFDLYRVNPPLVRLVAALPVYFGDFKRDWGNWDPQRFSRSEFPVGRQLISANRERSRNMYFQARCCVIPFSVLGAFSCFLWGRALWGTEAGLVALTLWAFSPMIMGHGQMITPDVPAAATGSIALYAFRSWLLDMSLRKAIAAGAFMGIALATKGTWVILFLLYPGIWLGWRIFRSRIRPGPRWSAQLLQICVMMSLGLHVLNCCYGYAGSFKQLSSYQFLSTSLSGLPPSGGQECGNRFRNTVLGQLPVPFPSDYIQGIDWQRFEFEDAQPAYMHGQLFESGRWYYYMYALLVKMPIGFLAVFALGIACLIGDLRKRRLSSDIAFTVLIPFICLFVLVSSQTGINKHLRYALPAFPFIFVIASRAVAAVDPGAWHRAFVAVCLVCSVSASLSVYPHSMSFFNAAVGGPLNGPRHLLNSNVGWGQDLYYLCDWIDAHEVRGDRYLAVHANYAPSDVGVVVEPFPSCCCRDRNRRPADKATVTPPQGWYVLDVSLLYGYPYRAVSDSGGSDYVCPEIMAWFRRQTPVDRIGFSLYVYRVPPAAVQ